MCADGHSYECISICLYRHVLCCIKMVIKIRAIACINLDYSIYTGRQGDRPLWYGLICTRSGRGYLIQSAMYVPGLIGLIRSGQRRSDKAGLYKGSMYGRA